MSVGESIAAVLVRTADRPHDKRWALDDRLKSFTVPELRDFLAAEGIRFSGRPKRAEVVAEILDIFAPEED